MQEKNTTIDLKFDTQYRLTTCDSCVHPQKSMAIIWKHVKVLCLYSRIQRSVFFVRQGRWWNSHNKRIGHRHEVPRSESHRGRTSGHDQWSRCRRWVEHYDQVYNYAILGMLPIYCRLSLVWNVLIDSTL